MGRAGPFPAMLGHGFILVVVMVVVVSVVVGTDRSTKGMRGRERRGLATNSGDAGGRAERRACR